jgi:exodeoxyribonuclease V gamma subunit
MRRPGFLGSPLVSGDEGPVELDALRAFLRDPVGTFVSRTLQATLPRSADDVQDILPVEPDGLEKYHIGQNLLDARLRGTDDDTWRRVERAKGALPPGVLEDRLFADVSDEVDAMLTEAVIRGVGSGEPVLREVDVIVPEGTRIVGTVPLGLVSPHEGPGRILFSRPKEAYRLEAWLDLMVLVATDPTVPWRSVVVTRTATKGAPLHPIDLVPVQGPDLQDRASDALGLVVDLYRKGLTEPLPLFASYSPAVHRGESADDAWKRYNGGGDGTGPAVRLVFGDVDVDEIDELPPLDGDPAGVGNRAERFAHHLWGTVDATVEQAP